MSAKKRNEFKRGIFVFHSIEFLILLFILSFVNQIFLMILLGVVIHLLLDYIDMIIKEEPLYNKIFPLVILKRNKNKKELSEL